MVSESRMNASLRELLLAAPWKVPQPKGQFMKGEKITICT